MSGILWPIKGGTIGQRFGRPAISAEPKAFLQADGVSNDRRARWTAFTGGVEFNDVHMGTDVICPIGTAIVAPEDGVLLRNIEYRVYNPFKKATVVGRDMYYRFGNAILCVAHLSRFVLAEGAHAKRGQLIGRTGDSGLSSGPHAHLEIWQGTTPMYYAAQFRWNPERLREGGDLAGMAFIKP